MGTPHRGSDLVPWTLLLSNLINIASLGQGIRKELLRNIDKDSITLMDISSQFVHRATPLKIMSFTEQNIERPLTKLAYISLLFTSSSANAARWFLKILLCLVFLMR